MLSTCAIFYKAHHQAVALIGIDDDRGDLRLLQFKERFQPPLATDEIIFHRVAVRTLRDGDRSLQADPGNAVDHLLESPPVADPWIQNTDTIRCNQRDMLRGAVWPGFRPGLRIKGIIGHQATSEILALPAMSKKKSSEPKR